MYKNPIPACIITFIMLAIPSVLCGYYYILTPFVAAGWFLSALMLGGWWITSILDHNENIASK